MTFALVYLVFGALVAWIGFAMGHPWWRGKRDVWWFWPSMGIYALFWPLVSMGILFLDE